MVGCRALPAGVARRVPIPRLARLCCTRRARVASSPELRMTARQCAASPCGRDRSDGEGLSMADALPARVARQGATGVKRMGVGVYPLQLSVAYILPPQDWKVSVPIMRTCTMSDACTAFDTETLQLWMAGETVQMAPVGSDVPLV